MERGALAGLTRGGNITLRNQVCGRRYPAGRVKPFIGRAFGYAGRDKRYVRPIYPAGVRCPQKLSYLSVLIPFKKSSAKSSYSLKNLNRS